MVYNFAKTMPLFEGLSISYETRIVRKNLN